MAEDIWKVFHLNLQFSVIMREIFPTNPLNWDVRWEGFSKAPESEA